MDPGIYPDLSHDTYHGGPGVNVSRLKTLAEEGGPARLRFGEPAASPAFRRGTLHHCAILEAEELERRYCPTDLEREGTNAWREAVAQACGRELVKRPAWDMALQLRDNVMRSSKVRSLLGPGLVVEQSVFWRDEDTGLLCRCRPDGWRPDWCVVADVKTCQSASMDSVRRAIREYRYYWQDGWYTDGLRAAGAAPNGFFFVFVENAAPNLARVVEVDPEDVELGRDECRAALRLWAECERTDVWPGFPDEVELVSLEDWHRARVRLASLPPGATA